MRTAVFLIAVSLGQAQDSASLRVADSAGGPQDFIIMPVSVDGTAAVAAFQFDLHYPAGLVEFAAPSATGPGITHVVEGREVAPGRARVVVYSLQNHAFPATGRINLPLRFSAQSPEGGPALTVSDLIFVRSDGTRITATADYGPITDWRTQHFTPGELTNPAVGGDDADPDGDGIPNLVEYMLGTNPRSAIAAEQPKAVLGLRLDGGQQRPFLAIEFLQNPAVTGVQTEAEATFNLRNWHPAEPLADLGPAPGSKRLMQARMTIQQGQRGFLRLKTRRAP